MAGVPERAILKIKLLPRASRNEVVGFMDDGTLKVKLTAPPIEGKANHALLKFMGGLLSIPADNIEILSGKTSHNKLISIAGISQDSLTALVQKQISS